MNVKRYIDATYGHEMNSVPEWTAIDNFNNFPMGNGCWYS